MGLTVVLETENGVAVEHVGDPTNILHRVLPRLSSDSHCLGYIDWYGDTVFNRVQMDRFLHEWRGLRLTMKSPQERELFDAIEGLALRCQREPHWYLKFYGD